jgi:hypothetical protein
MVQKQNGVSPQEEQVISIDIQVVIKDYISSSIKPTQQIRTIPK